MKLQLLKTDYFTKDRSAGHIHAGQYSKELHNLSICLEHSPPSCRWHIWYMCQPQLHRTLQHELLVYKPLLHRFLQQDLQCHVWKTPLREEKVNWFRVWRTPAPPPLKLWRISSRDMSGVVMFPPSLLNSPEGQQKLRAAQQQQHLLTVWGHRLMSSPPPTTTLALNGFLLHFTVEILESTCEWGGSSYHWSCRTSHPQALWKVERGPLQRRATLGHMCLESQYDGFLH